MQIHLEQTPVESLECDALIALTFEGAPNDRFKESLSDVYGSGEITGKIFEMTLVHRPQGFKAQRLLLAGAGPADKFTSAEMRRVAGAALRHLKSRSLRNIGMWLTGSFAAPEYMQAAVEGALLGDYEPDRYKSDKKEVKVVDHFTVAAPGGGADLKRAAERGRTVAEAQNFARELSTEPANKLTPTSLAEAARQMADANGLECEVLDQDRMRQLGMGSLLGVAQGSAEPPALIVLRYQPANAQGAAHLGLVGKGVTFDTGGISIKPADGMEKMKYDMSGGAAMIGTMRALSQLKPPIPVTALIPAVENMPGSRAQRPGDIVTSLSGKTIEVINTDAEGRLILADALTYARRLGCTHLVDAATLTGAVVVALGHVNIGAFGTDDTLMKRVLDAARAAGEKTWRMPLDDDYKEQLKSTFADMANVGGRPGGSITAALFLSEFAEKTPWVHLDIAGTAWLDDAKPYMSKGPVGVGVRTFVSLAMNWAE
ncbi:MAG TPA: leucyl aminopeptidase [Bryobacteraceae bacterium]|nr:leucyl aminopeptidase [Bryobacteraceae bacterium]